MARPHENTVVERRKARVPDRKGTQTRLASVSGRWQRLEAGMFLHMPPNHPHAVRAGAGPFSMLLTLGAEPVN